MNHTPTPWRIVGPMGDERPSIVNTTADGKVEYYIAEMIEGYRLANADAAFIVKACNAHDELVAALDEIILTAVDADLRASFQRSALGFIANRARKALAKAGQ